MGFLGLGGIEEYAPGTSGPGDAGSGPIVFGMSVAATGFALASARSSPLDRTAAAGYPEWQNMMRHGWQPGKTMAMVLLCGACGARSALPEGVGDAGLRDAAAACASAGGACGQASDCCAGSCTAGACVVETLYCTPGDAPVKVAQAQPSDTYGLVLDDAYAYWADSAGGHIWKAPKSGGEPTSLAQGNHPRALALDATYVYWAGDDGVNRVPRAGGPVQSVAGPVGSPWFVALDDTNVYWTSYYGSEIWRSPKDGSAAPVALVPGAADALGLAVDGARLYYVDSASMAIRSMPKAGGATLPLAPSAGQAAGVTVDDGTLYWVVSCEAGCVTGTGSVASIPKAGGVKTVLAASLNQPAGVTVDATTVYWTEFGTNIDLGAIRKVDKGGTTPPVTLVNGGGNPETVAVDTACIYWLDGTGALMKVHK